MQVVFVPGNHELWVTGRGEGQDSHGERVADSLGKLAAVRRYAYTAAWTVRHHRLTSMSTARVTIVT